MAQNYVKIIVTNNIIEYFEYEKLNVTGAPPPSAYEVVKGEGREKEENYKRYQQVRRDAIRRLVTMNFDKDMSKFITLTFKENIKDVKVANKHFHTFVKRLRRRFTDLKYVAVIEFQDKNKRGAVHYHMIANLPYIKAKELETIWSNGFIKINAIDKVDNIGAYVIKYMTKDQADPRLQGLKAYNCSIGLDRPTEITTWKDGTDFTKLLFDKLSLKEKTPVYSAKYTSEHAGQIIYRQYNLTRSK